MKKIKLSGREACVLRAISFSLGASGADISVRTSFQQEDLLDILHGFMDAGFVETDPPVERVEIAVFESTLFEINPSYALELKEAILAR